MIRRNASGELRTIWPGPSSGPILLPSQNTSCTRGAPWNTASIIEAAVSAAVGPIAVAIVSNWVVLRGSSADSRTSVVMTPP